MSAVIGIDLSLTSTGMAWTDAGRTIGSERIRSTGKAGDDLMQRHTRLASLREQIGRLVTPDSDDLDLAVLEAPSYGSSFGSAHDRSGLWWFVVDMLRTVDIPVALVSPQGRAKYATGKGNSKKPVVIAAARERYGDLEWPAGKIDDIADAVVLAAMGSRYLGEPVETDLPAKNLEAMSGVHWPGGAA